MTGAITSIDLPITLPAELHELGGALNATSGVGGPLAEMHTGYSATSFNNDQMYWRGDVSVERHVRCLYRR